MNPADRAYLVQTVHDVKARIVKYRGTTFNEQDTKATLIEPILKALGWDTHDPEQVRREFKTNPKDNPVDYALLLLRQPRLMVEAKGLGESLEDRKWVGQMIGYAAVGGALWCLLTNGDEFQIYNATAPVEATEKMLCKVRLSDASAEDSADILALLSRSNLGENRIDLLWKAQHVDRKVRAVLMEVFAVPDKKLIALVRLHEAGLQPKDILDSLRRLTVRIDEPQVRMPATQPRKPKSPKPKPTKVSPTALAKSEIVRKSKTRSPTRLDVQLTDLIAAGLLAGNTRLFRVYRKTLTEAVLLADGTVRHAGQEYPSSSAAANAAREAVVGQPVSTNGWAYWQVEGPGGKPRTLETLREQYLTSKSV